MYSIQAPALMEIQLVGRLHGQRTRNVFHYLYKPENIDLNDGRTAAENARDNFDVQVWNALQGLVSQEFTCEFITAQWVLPTRYRAVIQVNNEQGEVQGSSLPSYCAVVVSKYANNSGPIYQGRNYFAGIPVTSEADSLLSPAAFLAWDAFIDNLLIPLNLGLPEADVVLCTATPDSIFPLNVATEVNDVVLKNVLRAQRRREVGVGE